MVKVTYDIECSKCGLIDKVYSYGIGSYTFEALIKSIHNHGWTIIHMNEHDGESDIQLCDKCCRLFYEFLNCEAQDISPDEELQDV